MAPNAPYLFNQTPEQRERDRLTLIERYHDPRTCKRLRATGLTRGWDCLEIGPGAGSIMRWLARTVGSHGSVMAVDINPRFVNRTTSTNIHIVQGDIATTAIPSNTVQLAHARCVLIHTPAYRAALTNMVRALRPGGWLVLEEPDFSVARVVAGTKQASQSVELVNQAITSMFDAAGLNPAFGVQLPKLVQELGLNQLTVENDTPIAQGGSPLSTIMKLSAYQLKDRYLATGMITTRDITRYGRFAEDPTTWAIYHGTIVVSARKTVSHTRTRK